MKTLPEIQARDFHKKQIASVVMNFSSIPWTISFHIGFIWDKNTQVFEKKKQKKNDRILVQILKRKICFTSYFILIPVLNVLISVSKRFAPY